MYHYILNEEHFTFHPQYKHSGTFTNRKYEELSYPKNQKMCDPILVTLLKMRSHYSQSSRENASHSHKPLIRKYYLGQGRFDRNSLKQLVLLNK